MLLILRRQKYCRCRATYLFAVTFRAKINSWNTDRELDFYSGSWSNYFLAVRRRKFTSSGASVQHFFTQHWNKLRQSLYKAQKHKISSKMHKPNSLRTDPSVTFPKQQSECNTQLTKSLTAGCNQVSWGNYFSMLAFGFYVTSFTVDC